MNSYTWDRANRLLSMGGASYAYDGAGNRIRQNVGTDITQYLLDVQPGLAVVLSATTGTDTTRSVHGLRGIHAQQDGMGAWDWLLQDGLGSVRAVVDGTLAVQERRMYAPYGEPTDADALVYLRARYLNPGLGVFASRDPWEGLTDRPMSLNGYSWGEGNVLNAVDPSGLFAQVTRGSNCPTNLAKTLNAGMCISLKDNGYDCSNLTELRLQYDRLEQFRRSVNIEERLYQDFVFAQTRNDIIQLRDDYQAIADASYFSPNLAYSNVLLKFRALVRAGGPLDIKRFYVDEFGQVVWLYNGFYDTDITGNLLYGYIGRFVGFSSLELFAGAGIAQYQDNPAFMELSCLGDQCVDHAAVIVGINLFNTYSINWGHNELKEQLQQHARSLHRAYDHNDAVFANALAAQGINVYYLSTCLGGDIIGKPHEFSYFVPCSGLNAEALISCLVDSDTIFETRREAMGIVVDY